jgi:hypothetical protein
MAVNLKLSKFNKYAGKIKLSSHPGRTFQYPGFSAPFSYYHLYVPRSSIGGRNKEFNLNRDAKDLTGAGSVDNATQPLSSLQMDDIIKHPVKVSEAEFSKLLNKSSADKEKPVKRQGDQPKQAKPKKLKVEDDFAFDK